MVIPCKLGKLRGQLVVDPERFILRKKTASAAPVVTRNRMPIETCLPRPEYPRPDRERGFIHGVDWKNLNSTWEFRFDSERVGANL